MLPRRRALARQETLRLSLRSAEGGGDPFHDRARTADLCVRHRRDTTPYLRLYLRLRPRPYLRLCLCLRFPYPSPYLCLPDTHDHDLRL